MSNLSSLLEEAYSELQSKMYKCKTIHLRYDMTEDHKQFLIRQAVLSIYSAWEGFLKIAISQYLQELNKENLNYTALDENYLAYQTDKILDFKAPKTSFGVMKKISNNVYAMFNSEVIFNTKVNTESNANLKVSNSILDKLKLKPLDKKYERDLNKLLLFRNSVAHGDDGIQIIQSDIDFFTILVQKISADIISSVIDGFEAKVYLKHA